MDSPVLFDLDDLWDGPHPEIWHGEPRVDLLFKLKGKIPGLKVTLFASPGLCSMNFLKHIARFDWIELGLHGWYHTSLECQNWTRSQADYALSWAEQTGLFKKIFRPPQWAQNIHMVDKMKEKGWIYAGHSDNPAVTEFHHNGGKVYFAATKFTVPGWVSGHIKEHGHLTSGIANSIDVMFDFWAKQYKDAKFESISEVINNYYDKQTAQNLPGGQQPV